MNKISQRDPRVVALILAARRGREILREQNKTPSTAAILADGAADGANTQTPPQKAGDEICKS